MRVNLDSLLAYVKYFKDLGYTTSSNTLVSRIKSGMEYNGYIVKFGEDQTSTHPSSYPLQYCRGLGGPSLEVPRGKS